MASINKVATFNGDGDVNKFITKCELHCTLNGYEGEKKGETPCRRIISPKACIVIYKKNYEETKTSQPRH